MEKYRYLKESEKILKETCLSCPVSIKTDAWKFGIFPSNLQYWKQVHCDSIELNNDGLDRRNYKKKNMKGILRRMRRSLETLLMYSPCNWTWNEFGQTQVEGFYKLSK